MKLPLSFVLGCALLLPGAVRGSSFEGKVAMKITADGQAPRQMDFSLKDGFSRIDVQGDQGMNAAIIMDSARARMIFILPSQRMYLIRPWMRTAGANPGTGNGMADKKGASLQVTASREKILGYDALKYVVTSDEGTTEIWATDQLGSFMGLGSGKPLAGSARPPAGWESALQGRSLFPLRVVSTRGGKEVFRMEALSIQKQSLPADTFEPPAGYRDIGAMMPGGMMPGGAPPGP